MLTNNAQVVQFYSAPLACFADALDSQRESNRKSVAGEQGQDAKEGYILSRRALLPLGGGETALPERPAIDGPKTEQSAKSNCAPAQMHIPPWLGFSTTVADDFLGHESALETSAPSYGQCLFH